MPGAVHEKALGNWTTDIIFGLSRLSQQRSALPINVGATSFRVGPGWKQADASFGPTKFGFPSIVLEVGDSESLSQLKIDARLWLEHPDIHHELPPTHQNFFRYSWSSSFQSAPPNPPSQIFQQSSSNCGEALKFNLHHTQQMLKLGKPVRSGLLTGPILQHLYTYYFLTSSEDRSPRLMVTMIVCSWIL